MKYYRLLIAGLFTVVIGSWLLLFHYYTLAQKPKRAETPMVQRVVASTMIPKGKRIEKKDLGLIKIDAHSVFSIKQPSLDEIVGKYAKQTIYPTQMITRNLLSNTPPSLNSEKKIKKKEIMTKQLNFKGFAIPLKVFQNGDIPLHKGEKIDIVAVTLKGKEPYANYSAINVPIEGFILDNTIIDTSIIQVKKEKRNFTKMAQYIILDLAPKDLINVLQKGYKSLEVNAKRVYTLLKSRHAHLWIIPSTRKENTLDQILKLSSLKGDDISYTHKTMKKIRQKKLKKRIRIYYEK